MGWRRQIPLPHSSPIARGKDRGGRSLCFRHLRGRALTTGEVTMVGGALEVETVYILSLRSALLGLMRALHQQKGVPKRCEAQFREESKP